MLVFIGQYLQTKICIFVYYLVCYDSNQSLCVASRWLRHDLDQNNRMYTCVRLHCNFKKLLQNEKRSHNPHLCSKCIISLAGNPRALEKLFTLWLKFLTNYLPKGLDENLGVPRSRYGVPQSRDDPKSGYVAQTGVVPDLVIRGYLYKL